MKTFKITEKDWNENYRGIADQIMCEKDIAIKIVRKQ